MARYIDADKFKRNLEAAMEKMHSIGGVKAVDVGAVIKALGRQPTADVAPKSEVEKLELTLQGVMRSVDKWLDEADYDADPIKRAITMREKTLQVVEKLEQDNEDLRNVLANTINKYRNCQADVAREIFEEIERETKNHGIAYTQRKIAELKKKYTEGNNGYKQIFEALPAKQGKPEQRNSCS